MPKKIDSTSKNFYYTVELSETKSNQIEIMRNGKWKHPLYGNFEITDNILNDIKINFDNRVRGIDINFDLEHGETSHKGEAVCWVKKLIKTGSRLLAEVDWTEFGKSKIKDKSFKYFSPEFRFIYEDSETLKKFNNVLIGGSLTNKPFIKKMSPIMLSENIQKDFNGSYYLPCESIKAKKEENIMNQEILKSLKLSEGATEEQIKVAIDTLVSSTTKLAEKDIEISTLKTEKIETNNTIETLKAEKTAIELKLTETIGNKSTADQENITLKESVKAIELQLKEADWNNLSSMALTEGKLLPTMMETFKSQYMSNPSATKKIIECLQPVVKLGEEGSSKNNKEVNNVALFKAEVAKVEKEMNYSLAEANRYVEKNNPSLFQLADNERRGIS